METRSENESYSNRKTWWTFQIFFIFSARGRGRGGPGRQGEEGGGFSQEGGRTRGSGGCLQGMWGGEAKYFFSGPKCPPRKSIENNGQHAYRQQWL